MGQSYSYASILETSQRAAFGLDDVLREGETFDFARPFLPEGLSAARAATQLSPGERLTLNQVRGHSYLCLFGVVEEFILPFVVDHARADLASDDQRTRALLGFAAEEAKHIQLFKRFQRGFEAGFRTPCQVIGPSSDISRTVLGHGQLAVALLILHIEWMTQRHYVDGVHDDASLDPQFKRLLKAHWQEEAQHAKLDGLMVEQLAAWLSPREREASVDEYLQLVAALSGLLDAQLGFDLDSLERALGRTLASSERAPLEAAQRRALHWTFLGSGMTHPKFLASVAALSPESAERVRAAAGPYGDVND